ncbi:MAG: hypothetical protein JRJ75_17920, partial [Deltaproteobacteria bacterium]|nr:hypothetical protein [Deltaproteobacteria bacterium]
KAEKERLIIEAKTERKWPYQSSIGFREYVQFGGPLTLALSGITHAELTPLLLQLNYIGKRGGFIQLVRPPVEVGEFPEGFTVLTESVGSTFPLGTLQMVDDCGPGLTFDHVNIYHAKKIKPGKDRVFHHVVLPLRPVRSSRGFTLYEEMETRR